MQSIIEDLYYGNLHPDERIYGEGSVYAHAVQLRQKHHEKLLALLDGRQREIFEKLQDTQAEIDNIASLEKFTFGLRFGVSLMAEVLCGT